MVRRKLMCYEVCVIMVQIQVILEKKRVVLSIKNVCSPKSGIKQGKRQKGLSELEICLHFSCFDVHRLKLSANYNSIT